MADRVERTDLGFSITAIVPGTAERTDLGLALIAGAGNTFKRRGIDKSREGTSDKPIWNQNVRQYDQKLPLIAVGEAKHTDFDLQWAINYRR
jgi:hypothetical protein